MPERSRFGRLVVALRWPIVIWWIAAAVLATHFLPTIAESQNGALGALVPTDAAAIDAELRSNELFGFPLLSRTVVVQRQADGLPAVAKAQTLSRAVAIDRNQLPRLDRIGGALPVLNAVSVPPFTRERATTAITYLYFTPDVGSGEQVDLAGKVADRAQAAAPHSFTGVTGAIPAREAQSDLISDKLPLVEIGTVLLVLLAIAVHYRAFLAPLVTLAAVAVTYGLTVRLVAWIGERIGVSVPQEVQPVIVVLLFGILTDYAIFFLSRFRLRLSQGMSGRDAAERAAGELVGTVLAAGVTVAGASAALLVAKLGFFQTFGPGLALAVLLALTVAITFVPAMLAILGDAVFWPSRPGREVPAERGAEETEAPQAARPLRSRALRMATRHPVLTAVGCGAVLLGAASGLLRLHVGQTLIRGLPGDNGVRFAYEQASQGFAPGVLSPTVVLAEAPGVVARRHALRRLQREIAKLPGVALVVGPAQQKLDGTFGAVYSRTGNAARFVVVFGADPLGARAIARLRTLRARLPYLVARAGLDRVRTSIAGDTALAAETVRLTSADIGRVAPLTLVVVFLVLAAFLRALVAPLYLVAASVLALAASVGLSVYVFEDLLGFGELTYYVPFVAAVMLVALGSDYNVFLAGRVWQEARVRPFREAVEVGGTRAASAITVAGVVLALSFALLLIVPVRPFRELAFTMSCGLLIDAFLVRTLLAPSLMTLVGPVGGWPGHGLHMRRRRATPPVADRPAPPPPVVVAAPVPPPSAAVPARATRRRASWVLPGAIVLVLTTLVARGRR